MGAETPSDVRRITRPYSKLTRLCESAAACGGALTTFAAVAKAIELTPGRVTQLFGYGQEATGSTIRPETLGRIADAFTREGVRCKVGWLHLEFDDFIARLAAGDATCSARRGVEIAETRATDWQIDAEMMLPDLVELRLHPPRLGNEMPGSFYVDATLLFGTARPDYLPEDGGDPRSIAIALRRAMLAIGTESYQPLPDSMIGERARSPHYRRVAGGVEITGPTPEGTLDGDPLNGEHLAVIASTNTGNAPFAVTVAASWGSFVITGGAAVPAAADPANANRSTILNALIHKHAKKDALGRALLARTTMLHETMVIDPAP